MELERNCKTNRSALVLDVDMVCASEVLGEKKLLLKFRPTFFAKYQNRPLMTNLGAHLCLY